MNNLPKYREFPVILERLEIIRMESPSGSKGKLKPSLSSRQTLSDDKKMLKIEYFLDFILKDEATSKELITVKSMGSCNFHFQEPIDEKIFLRKSFVDKFINPIYQRMADKLQIVLSMFGLSIHLPLTYEMKRYRAPQKKE